MLSCKKPAARNSGQAIIVVIAVLSIVFIAGIAFYVLSQAERNAALRHLDSLRARYIAEAGVVYAQKLLDLDRQANLSDSLEDISFTHFAGQDEDIDGDTVAESRWIDMPDGDGQPFGRFSVLIADEASKVNLNITSRQTLEQLFSLRGADSGKADAALSRRPLSAIEQIGSALGAKDFALIKDYVTVYSRDPEFDLSRKRRVYLNSLWPQVALESFVRKGVRDAFQKAANFKDALDGDLAQTQLVKFSLANLWPTGLPSSGGWLRMGNYYGADAGSEAGTFVWSNLNVEDGEYYCFFNAPDPEGLVGEVIVDEDSSVGALVYGGEGPGKKVRVSGGSLTVRIRPPKDSPAKFTNIELVDLAPRKGLQRKLVCGTEALVINELMVKPSSTLTIGGSVQIVPGQTYRYTYSRVRTGTYYLQVNAGSTGGLVGDVSINGQAERNVRDEDFLSFAINVDCDDPKNKTGPLAIEIKNNSLNPTTFGGVKISQGPDTEYIEILNLSSQQVDMSNFIISVYNPDGDIIQGWPGVIPAGTKIEPYQHLVLVIDANDGSPAPQLLRGNGISFQSIWGAPACGLTFEESGFIDMRFDALPDTGGIVLLSNAQGEKVDAIKYTGGQAPEFTSIERGDPSAISDSDGDGMFEGWFIGTAKNYFATPGSTNENSGMYTYDKISNDPVKHYPTEVKVFNRPLTSLTEALQLSSGLQWKRFSITDLALMEDHFSYEAMDYEFIGHYSQGEFLEKSGCFESRHKDETGIWEFSDIPSGDYLLMIFADEQIEFSGSEKIQVAVKSDAQDDFVNPSTIYFTAQGYIFYGKIDLAKNPSALEVKIINPLEKIIRVKKIRLEPIVQTLGRINVNTAKKETLTSILSSESLAKKILDNLPIGSKDTRLLGVGELFLLDESFLAYHNYFTVKSDVYEIKCRGQYRPFDKALATQNIRTVVDRGG